MSHVWTIVGGPESGKTTEAIKLAKAYNLREIWIYDPNKEDKYAKYAKSNKRVRLYHGSEDGWFSLLKLHDFKGSHRLFISDECADYIPHGNKFPPVSGPARKKRHSGNVYIFIFHELSEVPAYVRRFTNFYLIKKSAGTPSTIAKTFANYPRIIEAWNYVNQSANFWEQKTVEISVKADLLNKL